MFPQQQSRDTKLPGVWQSQAGDHADDPDAHSLTFPHHSVLFFPCCSVTQHPRTSPEPSHQPACNGIILMSVVLLATHSTANTHNELLGRKGHSTALAQTLRGFSTILEGSRDRRGFTPCTAAALEPRDEPPCSAGLLGSDLSHIHQDRE